MSEWGGAAAPGMHTAISPLADKRVPVTGGATGIGRAIAAFLGSYGARLLIFVHYILTPPERRTITEVRIEPRIQN